jgi:hypothetical protein
MASDAASLAARATRRRRAQVVAAALLFALAAAAAGGSLESPRVLVGCAIVALAAMLWGWSALARLSVEPPAPDLEERAFGRSQEALVRHAALMQAQLDQAPVALWWRTAQEVEPLNNAARRLVAPGGATAPDDLRARLREAPATERHQLFAFDGERGPERCLLATRALVVDGAEARLLALMPIESELEAQTLQAWRQLVHVLTHEIMNSLTPIASLSSTAHEMIQQSLAQPHDAPARQDLAVALETIARRTESLATFVAAYRRRWHWRRCLRASSVSSPPIGRRAAARLASKWSPRR